MNFFRKFGGEKKRLIKLGFSHAFGQVVTYSLQLAQMPVLLRAASSDRVSDWIVLSTVPAAMSLLDIGIVNAVGTKIIQLKEGDNKSEIQALVGSAWTCMIVMLILSVVAAIASFAIPWEVLLSLRAMPRQESGAVIAILIFGAGIGIFSGFYRMLYRVSGETEKGVYWSNLNRLLGSGVFLIMVFFGFSILYSCVIGVVISTVTVFTATYFSVTSSRLPLNWGHFKLSPAVGLWREGAGSILPLTVQIFSLQLNTMVVSHLLGPSAVLSYVSTRTISRMVNQLQNLAVTTFSTETARLHQVLGLKSMINLVKKTVLLIIFAGVIGIIGIIAVIDILEGWWLNGLVDVSPVLVFLMVASVTAANTGSMFITPLTGNNLHVRASCIQAGFSVFSVGLLWMSLFISNSLSAAQFNILLLEVGLALLLFRELQRIYKVAN